ncbi:MAG: transrane sensor [Bacteroidota bacterium]|nr:transrane sensor [Bacteroidota bacterium]
MQSSEKATLKKVIEEKSSKEQARQTVNWMSSSIEGQQALSEMIDRDAYLMEDELLNIKISSIQSDKILSNILRDIRRKHIRKVTFSVAAVVIPLVLLLGWVVLSNPDVQIFGNPTYAEIYVPRGDNARIFFQDGTQAYLNADTKIRYPKKFGLFKRKVFLSGEAYFIVSPNKHRPFIVNTGSADVRVLGTSFNVKAYNDDEQIKVVLDEGKITFDTPTNRYKVAPGQQIVYDKTAGACTIQNLPQSSNISLWKYQITYLNDTPLSEVIRTLERKYDVSFRIKDREALKYTYTLTTRQTSLEEILSELQKIAPVKFMKKGTEIEVSLS